jgi:hypothetical protein
MRFLQPLLILGVIVLLVGDAANAVPRFSSRTGWKCQACHVNPSGGGMRSPGGVTYGREELPVPTWSDEFQLDDFSTNLTDFVSIGADVRTLFFYQQETPDDRNAFFQMQGDIYLNLKLAKKVNVYFDKGLYDGFELFGQVNLLPANGYIKAGKFVPNYGLKLDEHRAYIREFTGLSQETGTPFYTGAEVGISPGPATITAGGYNSSEGRGTGIDSRKALLGRAEGLFNVAEDLNLGIGANILYKNVMGGKTNFYGAFASFSYKDFTIIGEGDILKSDVGGEKVEAVVIYGEADYMVVQGVDLKVIYDFFDPDRELATGSFSRYSFGFEFFPMSGVEVRPLYRVIKEDPIEVDNDEFHLLVHFYL